MLARAGMVRIDDARYGLVEQFEASAQTSRWRAELRELLTRDPFFASLNGEVLGDLVEACEVVDVPGGTRLLSAGQPLDSLLGVLHGGLRVVRHSDDGLPQTMREFSRPSSRCSLPTC